MKYYINKAKTVFLMDTGEEDKGQRVMRRIAIRPCIGADRQTSILMYTVRVSDVKSMKDVSKAEFLSVLSEELTKMCELSLPDMEIRLEAVDSHMGE